jgi:glycosyltransferase involved in cell wall biosynthesis
MSKVLVVMSVYKNDKLEDFKEALESIYNQTYKDFDIAIQEDGEVSRELDAYLEKQLDEKKIIHLGRREQNKGFDYSLNELIDIGLKKGYTYFVRMDADDISRPERVKKQIDFLETNKNIDIVGTYIEEFGDGIEYNKVVKYPLTHNDMFKFFQKRVPVAHVSVVFRDSFFKKAGFYPTSGHINNGDTLMWLQGFKNGCQFANLDFVGVRVRVNSGFFGRRTGLDKAMSDFKDRLKVIKSLNYPRKAYLYAFATFIVNLLPPILKKLAYQYAR